MDSKEEEIIQEKIIQTHNGKIHSDETVAIALLTNYYARKNINVSVLRSRNSSYFNTSNILIDVGGVYNPEKLQFDHHQLTFSEKWDSTCPTFLSAAGLIWKHFGKEIIEMYLSSNPDVYDFSHNYTDETINDITNIIYFKLILEIDANDNGISLQNAENLNIPQIISSINDDDTSNDDIQNENFQKAVNMVGNIFDIKFKKIINSYFNFPKDLENVSKIDLSGSYCIVEEKIPTFFKCLNQLDPNIKIQFVIFLYNNEYTIKTRNHNDQKFSPICPIASEEIRR